MKRFLNLQRILEIREMSNPIKAFMEKLIHPLWDKLPNWVQIIVCLCIFVGGIVWLNEMYADHWASKGPLKEKYRW